MKLGTQGLTLAAAFLAWASQAGATDARSNSPASEVAAAMSERIPQPSLDKLEKLTRSRLAPESQRVDLAVPTFTHPTQITNTLFPISDLHSAVLVGRFEGKPWRAETTLIPDTRIVEWNGNKIETLQSQFVAYLSGRIYEVAVDHYAQADDGSVWYFGEDAFSYERGRISEVNETWHAGVEGPATMIMPGQPRVGDVYRPENIPGLIFEEVTVKEIGQTREGPIGEIKGVMVGQELHMEGDFEDKTFAPGYGELRSGLGEDYEANALAVPVDAVSEPLPAELPKLLSVAVRVMEAVRVKDWGTVSAGIDDLRVAHDAHQKRKPPKELDTQMTDALDVLAKAVTARDARAAPLAALNVALAAADLELRYRPPVEVDLIRIDLWARQLVVDAEAGEKGAVAGDVATLGWLRERIALDGDDAKGIDDQLRYLVAATDAKDMDLAANAAERLRKTVAGLAPK
jgi:hypothetical protein